jgi:polysaccharide biosynthesis protein VpsJ
MAAIKDVRHAPSPSDREDALRAARELEQWGRIRGWRGPDPYDGLNAARLRSVLNRSPMALRLLTQVVKRSALDLRPVLGIRGGLSAATLAHAISAYARNGFLDPGEARGRLRRCVGQLESLRCTGFAEPCWGYHFDVQTRVFFYPQTVPNTIATAFAALGLLDAHELSGEPGALELALGVGEFFVRHVPQTQAAGGAYFGYLPGDTTPIHNASMFVCAVLARLSRLTGREDFARAAAAGVDYTTSRQRPDGSWLYGEQPHLSWVDGFHTGYVLDCLLTTIEAGIGGTAAEEAWRRGLRFYTEALIDSDGAPRYTPESRYPIDAQCAAQAIQTLARAGSSQPELAERSWQVLHYALESLARPDGAFVFQCERLWVNRTAHPRWVQAPMLHALTQLIASHQ